MNESLRQNPVDWGLSKKKLDIFKGGSQTEKLREKLVSLAKFGIVHIDSSLAKMAGREASPDILFKNDPSHDFNHTMRVLRLAENMSVIGGDIDVIRAAVLFHDLITHSKDSPGAKSETIESAAYAKDLLEAIEFPGEKIQKVLDIITQTSLSQNTGKYRFSVERSIVFDADKLDQTGAIAVMRYFASGGQMGRDFFCVDDPFLRQPGRQPEVFKYTIDAMLSRLPGVENSITIPTAKKTAEQRNEFFNLFLKELEKEMGENAHNQGYLAMPGALKIMQVFGEAGKKSQSFYSEVDPFCETRVTSPESFPLDALIENYRNFKNQAQERPGNGLKRRIEFMENYFAELKYEFAGEIVPPPGFQITREIWFEDKE